MRIETLAQSRETLRSGGDKSKIAQKILNNKELVTKYVSAVDKTQGEINFLKLGTY